MTPRERLERIEADLAALVSERSSAVYFVPVGLVSMAMRFVRSAIQEMDRLKQRAANQHTFRPPGGRERGLPRGDW